MFKLDDIKLTEGVDYSSKIKPASRSKQTDKFIKGPIPRAWVKAANEAGSCAARLIPVLWFLRGYRGSKKFNVSNVEAQQWGVSRGQKARGLKQLEKAGLIEFVRKLKSSSPVVRLIGPGL